MNNSIWTKNGYHDDSPLLENKDVTHGISIHYVNDGLDEGPLIAQGEISINSHDGIDKVIERIHKIEHDLFPYIIKLICDNLITLDLSIKVWEIQEL